MKRMIPTALAILAVTFATTASAQISTAQDLFAVISLRGNPCGKVVEHTKLGDNDYDVVCQSGDRYRVYVKDDRVVVEKR